MGCLKERNPPLISENGMRGYSLLICRNPLDIKHSSHMAIRLCQVITMLNGSPLLVVESRYQVVLGLSDRAGDTVESIFRELAYYHVHSAESRGK